MKIHVLALSLSLLLALVSLTAVQAAGMQYDMRVDGLACPFCAYGIEKKLLNTPGVKSIDINIEKGIVIVKTKPDITFTDEQMKKLFHDAGFTYRSMQFKDIL